MLWIKSLPTRCCAFISVLAMFFACTPEENNASGTDEPGGRDKTIHVTGISLNPTAITIKEGESATITATVTPDNADNKAYSWSSSNVQVASVSDGKVVGIKAGSTTIIVSTEDGGKTATCSVTVEQNLAPSVTVGADHISAISALLQGKANLGNSASSDLKVGFQYSKSAGILPSNSTTIEATDADANYNYTASITALEPATKYYFRSFVRQNEQDTYGETKEFTTKEISSVLETLDATGVEATSAILNAKLDLTDIKYENIMHGFCWGTSEGSQNTFINGEAKDNAMTASMTALNHKTQYWYKAYVKLDNQTFYGEVKSFTTAQWVTSISLSKTSLSLMIGEEETISVSSVLPDNANNKSVTWSSSHSAIASVDNSGKVTAKAKGETTIKATANDGSGVNATCSVVVSSKCPAGAVDMGTTTAGGYKLYWGTTNIGASKPEDYGDYYAWGETEPKESYSWSTYKLCNGSSRTLTKYNYSSSYGTVDNKTVLEPSDDVASVKLGGKWRMPTDSDWTELRTKCTWTWTTNYNGTGVKGRIVTASNGNSIFLPAAGGRSDTNLNGGGSYWSSSCYLYYPDEAWHVDFGSGSVFRRYDSRCYGRSVRPVSE